jgi:hypothetical protein
MFDGGYFTELKRPGREAENWPPSIAKVKHDKVIPPLPHKPFLLSKSNICLSVVRFSRCHNADLCLLRDKTVLSGRVLLPLCSEYTLLGEKQIQQVAISFMFRETTK